MESSCQGSFLLWLEVIGLLFEGVEFSVVLLVCYCGFEDRDFSHFLLKSLEGSILALLTKFLE